MNVSTFAAIGSAAVVCVLVARNVSNTLLARAEGRAEGRVARPQLDVNRAPFRKDIHYLTSALLSSCEERRSHHPTEKKKGVGVSVSR